MGDKAEGGMKMGDKGKGARRETKRKNSNSVRGDFTSIRFS